MRAIIETYKYIDSFETNNIEFREFEDYLLIVLNNTHNIIYCIKDVKKIVIGMKDEIL